MSNYATVYGTATFGYDGSSAWVLGNSWSYSLLPNIIAFQFDEFQDDGFLLIKANAGVDYRFTRQDQMFVGKSGTFRFWCSKNGDIT